MKKVRVWESLYSPSASLALVYTGKLREISILFILSFFIIHIVGKSYHKRMTYSLAQGSCSPFCLEVIFS